MNAGQTADSDEVQAIVRRHVDWLSPAVVLSKPFLLGLSEQYVADSRSRGQL